MDKDGWIDVADNDWADISEEGQESKSSISPGHLLGAGAVATGAGVGLLAKPYLEEWTQVNPKINAMRKELGITRAEESFLPEKLKLEGTAIRENRASQIADVKATSMKTTSQLNKNLGDMDNLIISRNVNDLATDMTTKYPEWKKSAYATYDSFIDKVDDTFMKQDVRFSAEDFKTRVLDRAIDYAEKRGYTPNDLKPLMQVKRSIGSKLTSDKNVMLTYREMKGYLNSIDRQGKLDSNVVRSIKENWGGLIEKYAPEDVRADITKVNTNYRKFANVRNKLDNVIDVRTNTADTSKVTKYLKDYLKSNIDTGQSEVMKLLSEGNEVVGKIDSLGTKFDALKTVKGARGQVVSKLMQEKETLASRLSEIESTAQAQLTKLSKMRAKSLELLSQKAQLQKGQFLNPMRMVGRHVISPILKGGLKAIADPSGLPTRAAELITNPNMREEYIQESVRRGQSTPEEAAFAAYRLRGGI